MYGTNGAIKVDGLPEYDKVYTGASFGLGIKLNSKGDNANYWDFGLLYPIRSSSFNDDYDTVKNDPRISDISSPWPVLIVIGYNFTLN
jgi:predicted porin